jgi:ATP-dependent Lon protease
MKDVDDLPREARRGMKFVSISKAREVLKTALIADTKRGGK